MELKKAIESVLEGQAILFAGAGFSYGAKNKEGKVPSANDLKEKLLLDLGMDEKSSYSLEILSNFYQQKKSKSELINKLKEQYNILEVAEFHKLILNEKWKRVYTTNYDQVIEKASLESKRAYCRDAVVISDNFDSKDKTSICVHLNGYIDRLDEDKIDCEFKLTDTSYSSDTLVGNSWFEFMVNDFESASAIVVIGYSMQFDIDIKRLFSAPEIAAKVIFIDSPKIDEISKSLLERYAKCYPIGIEAFANEIVKEKSIYVPSVNTSFRSFKMMYRDTLTSDIPTYEEIVQFYAEGKENEKIFLKDSSGTYKYIVNRKAMSTFLKYYRNTKVFLALSKLGNGKSIFVDMVENELRREDVKIFRYRHRYDLIDNEIEEICKETKRCLVIIDNYPGHMDILNKFSQYGHRNITFLLTARDGVNLMFCRQLERALHINTEDIKPLYFNQLQPDEINDLAIVLENNALLPDSVNGDIQSFVKNTCNANFADLLLYLFDSKNIKNKLEKLYRQLVKTENRSVKEVSIFMLIKSVSNYDLTFHEILDLFNSDYISLRQNDIEFIPELFELKDGKEIMARSSIVSLALLQNIISTEDIIYVMKKAFLAADLREGRNYIELQKSMVSHSQFLLLTGVTNESDRLMLIEGFYNDIRNTRFARHNPFFWEQFASAYIDMKKFDMVKICIDTALREAKTNKNFVPFQVKTVQGRYYVEKCYSELMKGNCLAGEAIDSIANSFDAIMMYYNHPENNLYYVFKVVKFYSMIFSQIKENMDIKEHSIYIEKSTIMSKKMNEYLEKNRDSIYYKKIEKWNELLLDSINESKGMIKELNNK